MHSAQSSASPPWRVALDDPNISANDPELPLHSRSRSSAYAFPNSPKRRSVFGGRSRSNTTTSSSRRSPTSSMISTDHPGQEFIPPPRERQDSVTKSLFFRGSRILRRQGSRFNVASTLDEVDENERERTRFDMADLFGRHRSRQSETADVKRLISDPYDFHHLTHAGSSHVQSLQRARENELVTEFSAIRASQKPVANLKGIRADDLHFRNFSSDDLTTTTGVATSGDDEHAFAIPPPPASPPASPGAASSVSSKQVTPRRESRVCENFSRPVSRYPRTGSGSSIVNSPPQRPAQLASSPEMPEPAPRAIDHVLNLPDQPTYAEHNPRKPSLPQANLAGLFDTEEEDGADPRASTMNLAIDLEDVPEEEEAGTHWHESPEPDNARCLSPPADMGPSDPKSHPSIYVAEELSKKFTQAFASPTLPQYRLYQQEAEKKADCEQPPACDPIYDAWDADIDYCYEHAAESTSDFDWARQSLDADRPAIGASQKQSMHLSTSSLTCPDLDPSPSQSVPSTQFAVTPSTAFEGEYFPQVSAVHPDEKPMTQDQLYDEYNLDDRHFSLSSQGVVQPSMDQVSSRSSFSPVSNCNSQESLIISRAASIVRKHRSSVSTTSVPELVHSMTSSRETMPEPMPRPESSHHRQTKSLETSQLLKSDSTDVSSGTSHDRTKSTSDALEASLSKELPPLPPTATAKQGRKPSRTYSLFPIAQ